VSLSSPRRVAITGMGLVTPLGNDLETFWSRLTAGESGVGRLEDVAENHLPTPFAAEAREFSGSIGDFGELEKKLQRSIKKGLKVMCREIQMGVASCQKALSHAQLTAGDWDPDRTGVVFGSDYIMTTPEEFTTGIGKCLTEEHEFDFSRWAEEGMPEVTPLWLLKYLPNMPASHVAIYNDMRGPNNSLTLREASSHLAIAEAYHVIRRGDADVMLTGGTGSRVHPIRTVHIALQEEVAVEGGDPAALSRPFDQDRHGMVLGEGAAALVLEDLERAQSRGAAIYGEIVGYGSSTVLSPGGAPDRRKALVNVMRGALRSADMPPDDVGHIQAHGLSTRQCDIDEAAAVADVFGDRSSPPPVTAAKSYFGNLGAGSGAAELIAGLLALKHGELFPILNYEQPDPECSIEGVRERGAPAGNSVLSANVTPQAQAAAILVRRAA